MNKSALLFFFLLSTFSFAQDISGGWTGILNIQGTELPLILNFTKTATGYTAKMDSPKQGAKGIVVDEVIFKDKKLTATIKSMNIEYSGEWKNDTEIVGTFTQGTFSSLMNFKKGVAKVNRPQEPLEPFPYRTENVEFTNSIDNIKLGGTLSLPQQTGTVPAVILISGSGQQNRNSEIAGHKPFLVIADYLTRNGIAVLRYDDRGVGASKGDPTLSTSADFANDARAAIEFLRSRKEINTKEIGIIGHSEGGMIAPMIAATDKSLAFIISLAGTGVAGDLLLVDQNYTIGKLQGMTEEQLNKAKITNQTVYDFLKSDQDLTTVKSNLTDYFKLQIGTENYNALSQTDKSDVDQSIKQNVDAISSPWFRYFISYNPNENLKKVTCPVLVLNGAKDIQVTADLNTNAIATALKEGGNEKVTLKIFPELNHLFQNCTSCTIAEYSQLEETFSPEVLKTMVDWISSITK